MIEDIKKEIMRKIDYSDVMNSNKGYPIYERDIYEILDKYNKPTKWKCDVCGSGFNNFQAQGFDNKIYCPLCYYKKLYRDYKNCWEELQNLHLKTKGELAKETINETDVIVYTQMMILEQKYNLGSETNE